MKNILSISLICLSTVTLGQEIQVPHIAPEFLSSNGVSTIIKQKIIVEESAATDTTEIETYELDKQFRIVKLTLLKPHENSKREILYQYDSVGVTNVKILEHGIEIKTQNYDPTSNTDCFCPKVLDAGADRVYYPNGLLKREDHRQWKNEYLYEFENKN